MSASCIRITPRGGLRGSLAILLAAVLLSATALIPAGETADQSRKEVADGDNKIFARVGTEVITTDAFEQAYQRALRSRFYHGKPPEGQLASVQREVADEVVMRVLLLQEAERRGLKADDAAIGRVLEEYDRKYAGSAQWQAHRESMLKNLRARLAEEDVLHKLEIQVRQVPPADETTRVAYYHANPEKFTEPARQRVSVILLKVDPASPKTVWEAALVEGEALAGRIRAGEDFAELARTHSSDVSASQGGDMGYLHQGMLSPAAQQVVDALPLGKVSSPIRLLEGVALFRVDERRPAQLRAYADVAARVAELWARGAGDRAWRELRDTLKSQTPISLSQTGDAPGAQ